MAFNSSLGHFTSAPDLISRTWATATNYVAGDTVIHLDKLFKAVTTHTAAAAFLTDYNSGNWELINKPNVKNYILNESGVLGLTTGWSTYADASAATPVDGTGGNADITFTSSSSSSLRGAYNFLLTKPASDCRGQGASYDFVIDRADSTNMPAAMSVTFDYEIASGTYGYGTSSTDSDLTIYIVQDTSGTPTVVQPTAYKIDGGKIRATFQPSKSYTNYRLCFHIATTTSAVGWTMKISNIAVNPVIKTVGPAMTDWTSYTPTMGAGFGTTSSSTFIWKRTGDSEDIFGKFTAGTVAASSATFTLPSGHNIDTGKYPSGRSIVGKWWRVNSSASTRKMGDLFINSTSPNTVSFGNDDYTSTGDPESGSNGSALFTTADVIYVQVHRVAISGWSSNTLVSSEAETRVVAFRGRRSTNQTLSSGGAGTNKLSLNSTTFDTHGGWDGTSTYTIKSPGKYSIQGIGETATASWTAGQRIIYRIYINGSAYVDSSSSVIGINRVETTTSQITTTSLVGDFTANAGDTIQIDVESSIAVDLNTTTWLAIKQLQGPSQIAASEVIAAKYYDAVGQAFTGSATQLNASTKIFDTHGAVTTGASWKFTAPAPGIYRVTSNIVTTSSASSAATNFYSMQLYVGGVAGDVIGRVNGNITSAVRKVFGGSTLVSLNAGDYIDVRIAASNSGDSHSVSSSAGDNYIAVERIGGVM